MGTFANLETFFTGEIHHLLAKYLPIFSSKITLLLQLGSTTLILYYGYSIMTSRGSNATIQDMLFNLARIGIVLAFVQNSEGLLDLVIGFINELKTGFIEEKSLFTLLDEQFLIAQQLSEDVYKFDTAYIKLQGCLASLMIWLGTILVLTSSAIVFIAAEVSLALLTVTSPIFIGCVTYGFTRELFNGWLRSVFSCIITLIFATLVVKIGIDINKEALVQLAVSPEQKNLLHIGAVALGVGIIVSSLTFVATKMASNIAGVAATSAVQAGMVLAAKTGITNAVITRGMKLTAMTMGITNPNNAVLAATETAKYVGKKVSDVRKKRDATFKRTQQENSKSKQ